MSMKSASPGVLQLLEEVGLSALPSSWDVVRIEQLLSTDRGISVGVMYPGGHCPEGVPLIKAGDLGGNRIKQRPEFWISHAKHNEYQRTELAGGELLISLVGDVGRCAVVPGEMKGWNVARAIAVLRFNNMQDSHFVRLCLLSAPLQHLMQAWSTTTVQETLNLKEIRQLPIPWPSSKEREAIAHILGTLDDKIELNRRMNETLEAMARALFKSWFVDFEPVRAKAEGRDTGLLKKIADLFPDSFEDSELGEVPKGWRVGTLPDFIEVNPSRSLRKGEVAPYLDMANVPTNTARANEIIEREFGSGTKFKNGDTLLARITPCLENGKTAFVDFLNDGQIGWGSTEFIVLRPKSLLPPEFGYLLARDEAFRTFAISNMTGTSGRQRVPSDCFSNYVMAVPPQGVADAFGRQAAAIMQKIKGNDEESRTLATQRDVLLPKLLSGELRVKDVEMYFEELDDAELTRLVQQRQHEPSTPMSIDEL